MLGHQSTVIGVGENNQDFPYEKIDATPAQFIVQTMSRTWSRR